MKDTVGGEPATTAASLPSFHGRWLDQLLPGPIPAETEATCSDCAMCSTSRATLREGLYFDKSVKCCTYVPNLPNFIVGAILGDDRPELAYGRRTVEERLAKRLGASPKGLAPTPMQDILYREAVSYGSGDTFGRAPTLRCPHYAQDTGGCGIHAHREAICSTWFCKHVRGQVGKRFWNAVVQLLRALENELSCWALLELGLQPEQIERLYPVGERRPTADDVEGRVSDEIWRLRWGGWSGREVELYKECERLVTPLGFDDALRIAGTQTRLLARLAQDTYRAMLSTEIPHRLKVRKLEIYPSSPSMVRVETYSCYDPVDFEARVVRALVRFDGTSPTEDVVESIAAQDQLAMDDSKLRTLIDFGLLEAVADPDPADGEI